MDDHTVELSGCLLHVVRCTSRLATQCSCTVLMLNHSLRVLSAMWSMQLYSPTKCVQLFAQCLVGGAFNQPRFRRTRSFRKQPTQVDELSFTPLHNTLPISDLVFPTKVQKLRRETVSNIQNGGTLHNLTSDFSTVEATTRIIRAVNSTCSYWP